MKILTTILFLLFIFLFLFLACDDEGNGNTEDISRCKNTAQAFERCIGWTEMGTTITDALAECDKGDFDAGDHCMFDCAEWLDDCETLSECFDEC